MQTGVLLLNLGSPEAPTPKAVRPYLQALLGDPRVLEMPAPLRWLLLHGVILRTRPKYAAHAYSRIWTAEGSPLMTHTRAFAAGLAAELGSEYRVEVGMSCGTPFIAEGLKALFRHPLRELVVFPLYPQYASATTGSALAAVFQGLQRRRSIPAVRTVPAFFDHPAYLEAAAAVAAPVLAEARPDHVLFSFHGLPESQIRRAESAPGFCLASGDACCASMGPANFYCYRAQCFSLARRLAERLRLPAAGFSLSFQSRLGRTPWIRPYTDETLVLLAKRGIRRLAVLTPSFVADCLETLEEIGLRGAEAFQAAGGERLTLVPSLNADSAWIRAAGGMIRNF